MEKRSIERYLSFCASLDSLKKAVDRDISDEFVLSGTVMKYCLTFDISWKVMKDLAIQYYKVKEFATGSPRETMRIAASLLLISDDAWMDMLDLRNSLAHDYDGQEAENSISLILNVYIGLFEKFRDKVKDIFEDDKDHT